MTEIPFLHPALLGCAAGVGLAWAALAPERLREPLWALCAGVLGASIAAAFGWVPWSGSLRLTAYGALMLVAFLAGWWLARRRAKSVGIDTLLVREQIAIAAIAGIVGARVWFVIEYHAQFPDPRNDFNAWLAQAADLDRGGAVWFGGLALAVLALVLHARRNRMPLALWADCATPGVLLGLAIGRIGCFLNGCCYGRETALPWGVMRGWPWVHEKSQVAPGVTVTLHQPHLHPTQLYETLACLSLALILARFRPDRGAVAGWGLIGYACWRFLNEMLRGDYADNHGLEFSLSPLHLSSAQWMALGLIAAGIALVVRARKATPA